MQFGIFTVGDVTPDPTNGTPPTEYERIHAILTIAQKAEEVGLDVPAAARTSGRFGNSRAGEWAGRGQEPAPRWPASRRCMSALAAFMPVIRTRLPCRAYLVSMASRAATVDASQM